MKITASRKDEILQRKAKYEEDLAAYNARHDESDRRYTAALNDVMNPVQQYLERKLSRYSALQFDVRVNTNYKFGRGTEGLRVDINCNDRVKFEDTVALAWSFAVELDSDGNVLKSTSSWSGLKATTEEQLTSLRQTLAALEWLNDADWSEILDKTLPNFYDYYDRNDKRPEREDFDQQLKEAEIEEMIGENKAILVTNWGESCPYRVGQVYVQILGETPSQYRISCVPSYRYFNRSDDDAKQKAIESFATGNGYECRVRKSSIHVVDPIDTIEF